MKCGFFVVLERTLAVGVVEEKYYCEMQAMVQ